MSKPLVKALMAGIMAASVLLPSWAEPAANDLSLAQVLDHFDRRADDLASLQSSLTIRNWTHLLDEFDKGQTGRLYVQRKSGKTSIRLQFETPQPNTLLVKDGVALLYRPVTKEAVSYKLGERKDASANLFSVLLSDRETLERDFDMRLLGREEVNGANAYQLELKPKSERIRAEYSHFVCWLHPEEWVLVRQEIWLPNKDFQRIDFSANEINAKLPKSIFDLKIPKDVKRKTL